MEMPWDTSSMSDPRQKHSLSQISNAVVSDSAKRETSVSSIPPLFPYLPSTDYFKMSPKPSSSSLSSWLLPSFKTTALLDENSSSLNGLPTQLLLSYITQLPFSITNLINVLFKTLLGCLGSGCFGAFNTPHGFAPPTSGALILLTAPSPLLEHGSHTHTSSPALGVIYKHTSVCFWIPLPSGFPDFMCLVSI